MSRRELSKAGEKAPLSGAAQDRSRYNSDAARSLVLEGFLCAPLAGFTVVRSPPASFVQAWIGVQVLLLFLHLSLYWEVKGHMAALDAFSEQMCGPEHIRHGKCVGPSWSMASETVLNFGSRGARTGADWVIGADRSFSFSPVSCPPTVLVGVEPMPPHNHAGYSVAVWTLSSERDMFEAHPGARRFTFKPANGPHSEVIQATKAECGATFKVDITLRSTHESGIAMSTYALDSTVSHLELISSSKMCDFKLAWSSFEDTQAWRPSHTLGVVRTVAFMAIVAGVACTFRVYALAARKSNVEFGAMVGGKYWLVDVPLQVCLVMYLYHWYRNSGMRCQLCLFDPEHCEDEHPLHFSNGLLCAVTVLSSAMNQLILAPSSPPKDEDEHITNGCLRLMLFSLATLPFSFGLLVISVSTLHVQSVWIFILLMMPMGVSCCAAVVALDDDIDF